MVETRKRPAERSTLMSFEELSYTDQVGLIKHEFENLIERLFIEPRSTYRYVETGDITKKQAKLIRNKLNTLNYYSCLCCRRFDKTKLTLPVEEVFEPIIDIVKKSLKQKQ